MTPNDLPGGWLTLALFLIAQLGTAVAFATRLDGRVKNLEDGRAAVESALAMISDIKGRLVRIEVILERIDRQSGQ